MSEVCHKTKVMFYQLSASSICPSCRCAWFRCFGWWIQNFALWSLKIFQKHHYPI